jgi:hypothetical protein
LTLFTGIDGLSVKTHIHHETGAYNDDCVAVRRCLGHFCACNVAAGAGSVINVELLTEGRREFFCDDTRDRIGRTASSEADHHSH